MFDSFLRGAVLALCLLIGVMAGFFFAFSNTVMPGLDLMPGTDAMQAMQNINIAVRNPVFFAIFAGTPILSVALAAMTLMNRRHRRTGLLLLVTMLIYVVGVVALTASINVPMNRSLALLSLMTETDWLAWSGDWTLSNHARTVASVVSLLLAVLAACRLMKQGRDGVAHGSG